VSRVVVSREAEWDEEETAQQLALTYLDRNTCSGCGGYLPQTMRKDIGRDVQQTPQLHELCLDCEAIKRVWDGMHAPHKGRGPRGQDQKCTCHETSFHVAAYLPIPEEFLPD
jgi:hypothetical protein